MPETLGALTQIRSEKSNLFFVMFNAVREHSKKSSLLNMFKISKGYNNEAKTIRLPIPLSEELERLAGKNNISFNQLVIQCLNYAIEHLDEENNEEERNKIE